MKFIRIFLTFVIISLFVGLDAAYNGKSTEQLVEDNPSKVETIQNVEEKEDNQVKIEDEKIEVTTNNEPITVVEKQKTEEKKENSSVQQTPPIDNVIKNNQAKTERKPSSGNSVVEKPKEKTMWEELGITEYEYYNSPMLKWQHVTHSSFSACQEAGSEAIKVKVNPETGESYQDYTSFWCYDVNSYSGKWLGIMLSLSK